MRITIKQARESIKKLQREGAIETILYLNTVRKYPSLARDRCYQKKFNYFYKVRQKNAEFYHSLFELLNHSAKYPKNVTIESLIYALFDKTGQKHLSFCSKLLATVKDDAVIFDKNVASQFGVTRTALPKKNWEHEIKRRYDLIKCGIESVIKHANWVAIERMFDESFQKDAQSLSKFRKADLILWSLMK